MIWIDNGVSRCTINVFYFYFYYKSSIRFIVGRSTCSPIKNTFFLCRRKLNLFFEQLQGQAVMVKPILHHNYTIFNQKIKWLMTFKRKPLKCWCCYFFFFQFCVNCERGTRIWCEHLLSHVFSVRSNRNLLFFFN